LAFRTKAVFFSVFLLLPIIHGCGLNHQQQRFQSSFLPPAPRPATLNLVENEPPVVQSSAHINEVPNIISANPQLSGGQSRSDLLIEKAQQHFQQGKKYYQVKDAERARGEFDRAVDLMLEASDNPSNRQGYETRLEEIVDAIHRYDLAGLGSATNVDEPQYDKAPLEDILQRTFPVDPKLKSKVRDQVLATVSQLPLTVNDTVLGYIHYFSGGGKNTMIAGLRRAGRYRPLIQRILDEEGLPQELIHLAQAESGFLPRAVSRKAAAGMWQFMSYRGREYGLEGNRYHDDRLDPEKATRAAARHLRDLYQRYGDWYLAIAAYDCGPGVIDKAVARTGFADFFELRSRRVIPTETTNYVPIILAMTIMTKNAAEYGLDGVVPETPMEYDSVEATSPTHLALISDLTGSPLPELSSINPALLRGVAPAGYVVHVPKGSGSYVMAALQLIPAERRASWRMHTVESGETLASIGKRYKTTPVTIASVNKMDTMSPVVGDRLLIPASYRPDAPVVRTRAAQRSHTSHGSAKLKKTAASYKRPTTGVRNRRAAGFTTSSSRLARANR
jgi:membrane-bound lytic murein transglycosylase D